MSLQVPPLSNSVIRRRDSSRCVPALDLRAGSSNTVYCRASPSLGCSRLRCYAMLRIAVSLFVKRCRRRGGVGERLPEEIQKIYRRNISPSNLKQFPSPRRISTQDPIFRNAKSQWCSTRCPKYYHLKSRPLLRKALTRTYGRRLLDSERIPRTRYRDKSGHPLPYFLRPIETNFRGATSAVQCQPVRLPASTALSRER